MSDTMNDYRQALEEIQYNRSGKHLGAVRRWIQTAFRNGERVTWGSDEQLDGQVTPRALEQLAQRIREAVIDEAIKAVARRSGRQSG